MENMEGKKGNAAFKRWYERHRKEFNSKRASKYQEDAKYRKDCVERSRRYRKSSVRGEPAIKELVYKGSTFEVCGITTTAAEIGVSPGKIRLWEKKDLIPKPIFDTPHRYYTMNQVVLLANAVDELLSKDPVVVKAASDFIHSNWAKK